VKLIRGRGASAVGERDVSQMHNLACLLAGEPVQKFDGSLTFTCSVSPVYRAVPSPQRVENNLLPFCSHSS